MSEMKFGEFIQKMKESSNQFWCLTTVPTKAFSLEESNRFMINSKIDFASMKKKIEETKDMFAGKFYIGSVSMYFDNQQDINMLKIRYPEINE